jgi:hypothetical protein
VATHDYVIANGTGAAVRSDLNGALAAIVSQNSSATEPSPTYAYQRWADTTAGVMKMRNGANSAWISLYELDGTFLASDISLAAGSAAAPSLFFTGDTNTGIYSPGADQVGISTGGASRIVVDASGNVNIDSNTFYVDAANNRVGVGTTTPQAALDIGPGSLQSVRTYLSSTTDIYHLYRGTADGVGFEHARVFSGRDTSVHNYGSYLAFYTEGKGSGTTDTSVEQLRIDSSGRVGIGTTSPQAALDIGPGAFQSVRTYLPSATDTYHLYRGTADGVGFEHARVFSGRDTSVHTYGSYLAFYTEGKGSGTTDTSAERLRIDSSGRVGIGTTSPSNQLQLSTDSAGKPSTNTWTIVSDERIKEDIELADLDLCYEAIKAIPLKRYKWRDEIYTAEQVTDRRKLGWIAQDVETVFPKAVGTHEFKYNQVFEEGELISEDVIEDCRNLNSDQIYAAMYGAVQKLMAKVEALEATVTALQLGA